MYMYVMYNYVSPGQASAHARITKPKESSSGERPASSILPNHASVYIYIYIYIYIYSRASAVSASKRPLRTAPGPDACDAVDFAAQPHCGATRHWRTSRCALWEEVARTCASRGNRTWHHSRDGI